MTVSVSSRVAGRTAEEPGHEHVVDVAAVDEGLLAQGRLPAEAEALMQAQRGLVGAQHPQAQLARATLARVPPGGGEQRTGDSPSPGTRGDGKPGDAVHVRVP